MCGRYTQAHKRCFVASATAIVIENYFWTSNRLSLDASIPPFPPCHLVGPPPFFSFSPLFFSIALVFSLFPSLLKKSLNTKGNHFDKRDKGGELFFFLLCSPSLLDVLNNNMLHLLFSHLSPSWYLNFCLSILKFFFSPYSLLIPQIASHPLFPTLTVTFPFSLTICFSFHCLSCFYICFFFFLSSALGRGGVEAKMQGLMGCNMFPLFYREFYILSLFWPSTLGSVSHQGA